MFVVDIVDAFLLLKGCRCVLCSGLLVSNSCSIYNGRIWWSLLSLLCIEAHLSLRYNCGMFIHELKISRPLSLLFCIRVRTPLKCPI